MHLVHLHLEADKYEALRDIFYPLQEKMLTVLHVSRQVPIHKADSALYMDHVDQAVMIAYQ